MNEPKPPLVATQFSRGLMTGEIHYGFAFKREHEGGLQSKQFELVVGKIVDGASTEQAVHDMLQRMQRHQWVVDAILAADRERL